MISYNSLPVFLLILLLVSLRGNGQDDQLKSKIDTSYIEDLSEHLSLRVYGINKFNQFKLKDNEHGHELSYSPNKNLNLGFGFNYKWLGLGLAFNFPFINDDNEQFGKTNRFDFQTNIFSRKFLLDIYLQYYQGFYIANPETYVDGWTVEDNYPQRPDLSSTSLGSSFVYVFNNKKYSAKAAFVQTDLQKKSAGSFLLGGFLSFFSLSGDSSLVPKSLYQLYNKNMLFREVNSNSLGLAFGYSHNFVLWKKFYISLTLVPGIALQGYQVFYDNPEETREGGFISGRFLVRTAFVYNTEKSFAGITYNHDNFSGSTSETNQNSINFEVGSLRFFYGRRFRVNKKGDN